MLPDPHGRVKRVGSTSGEPNPSDTDTPTTRILLLGKIGGMLCFCRLQGPGILRSSRCFVNS